MRRRTTAFHPGLERFEAKRLLSAGTSGAHAASLLAGGAGAAGSISGAATSLPTQFLAYRITNPTYRLVHLIPPFQHVLVQKAQPVPGRVYNVLYVVVMNGTGQTFTAANNFR